MKRRKGCTMTPQKKDLQDTWAGINPAGNSMEYKKRDFNMDDEVDS